jgi:hypothetical protein
MELFPAADDDAWQLIKDVIDASDYYALIMGGRYGSLDDTGISYTEKEYDYAVLTKKPVIPLLHANPDNLPRDRTETDEKVWTKLKEFRARVEKRHTCVYWSSAEELKARMIVGLTSAIKRTPTVGWIRADKVPTSATVEEILLLRQRVAELEAEVAADQVQWPKGTEDLVQGDDVFIINFTFVSHDPKDQWPYKNDRSYNANIQPTWDEIFAAVAPSMIDETSDFNLRNAFRAFFETYAKNSFKGDTNLQGKELRSFAFSDSDISTCIVQLRALGLIRESPKKHSVTDTHTYWCLTPFGDHRMVQLRAIRRTAPHATVGTIQGKTDDRGIPR